MLIIWDYFGVIAQDSFWYTADRLAGGKDKSENIHYLQAEADLGHVSWDDYCLAVASDIGLTLEEVTTGYQKHDIKQKNILAIATLQEHTHVLLSNASAGYLKPIMEKLGLDKLFTNIFVSSDIGYAKPDPRAYQYVLKQTGFEPENTLMIDDSARNIDVAMELGMKGIVFEPDFDVVGVIRSLAG